jgi:hypothetical protein
VRQIDGWIEDNPCQRGINWISALETGARAVSWMMAYPFYAQRCSPSFEQKLAASLGEHMSFVEERLSTGRYANTHLVGEAAALVFGGLFLDSRHSERWLEQGVALLDGQIQLQTTTDGIHAERSIAYQRYFLDHYYLASALLTANGRALSAAASANLERMTGFLMDVLSPDGSAPAFGDCDDSRAIWMRADCPGEYRSILALGAVLFRRSDFKAAARGPTEEILWLLGLNAIDKFMEMPARACEHSSAAYGEGGYYVMRGGWRARDPVLVFDCGPLGHGPAGHGHADALSFTLHAAGYPFIVDSGTFSYNLDYRWRNAFRCTRAHNTVLIDGLDQSVPADRMAWDSMAVARCNRWITTAWFDLVDGEHDGYRRLPDPVLHRRVVVFFRPDTWCVWDRCEANATHDLEILFHLRSDCSVAPTSSTGCITLRSPTGERLHVWAPRDMDGAATSQVVVGDDSDTTAWFSPSYGTRVPAAAIKVARRFAGNCDLITLLSTSDSVRPLRASAPFQLEVAREDGSRECLFYRLHPEWELDDLDVAFDGQVLYRKEPSTMDAVVWADRFRHLSVSGLLEVRSAASVDRLVLEGERCAVEVAEPFAGSVICNVRCGTQVTINGRPIAVGRVRDGSAVAE